MLKPIIAVAAALMISTPAAAAPPAQAIQTRWLGDMTCGGWRRAPRDFEHPEKALLLNFILGFVAGKTVERGDNILADVEVSSIAAWVDDYCAANPLAYLVTAAHDLDQALIARRRG